MVQKKILNLVIWRGAFLKRNSKVTLDIPAEQLSTPVVMVQEVKEEVEPEPVVAAPVEGAAVAEGTAETPVAGENKEKSADAAAKPADKKEEKK